MHHRPQHITWKNFFKASKKIFRKGTGYEHELIVEETGKKPYSISDDFDEVPVFAKSLSFQTCILCT